MAFFLQSLHENHTNQPEWADALPQTLGDLLRSAHLVRLWPSLSANCLLQPLQQFVALLQAPSQNFVYLLKAKEDKGQ